MVSGALGLPLGAVTQSLGGEPRLKSLGVIASWISARLAVSGSPRSRLKIASTSARERMRGL